MAVNVISSESKCCSYTMERGHKWLLVASILTALACATIIALAASNYFGAISSAGAISALVLGSIFAWFSISGIMAGMCTGFKKSSVLETPTESPPPDVLEIALEEKKFEGPPFPYSDLPEDLRLRVMHNTRFPELVAFGEVSKTEKNLREKAIVARADLYGYEGTDFAKAKAYTHRFLNQIGIVLTQFPGTSHPSQREARANELKTFNTEQIYAIYAKFSKEDLQQCPLISKYLLKLIKDGVIKPTPLVAKYDHNKPLINAILSNDKNAVLLLLTLGADANMPAANGSPPLHYAAQQGFDEIVKLLLDYGAQVNTLGEHNNTALLYAVGCGGIKRPQVAIEKSVAILLAHKADVNLVGGFGSQALHFAAQHGYDRVVDLLLKSGAHVNSVNALGTPALCFAFIKSDLNGYKNSEAEAAATIRVLLAHNANPNSIAAQSGKTALHYAAQGGYNEAIAVLLENGANVDTQGNIGQTPLHIAALKKRKETVTLLIAYGADPSVLVNFI